jgi:hypothetical protein
MSTVWAGLVRRPWIALVCALAIHVVMFVVGQGDFVASDPLWYADIAHDLASSPLPVFSPEETHPFVMRIGLTGPLALLYRVFGVSTLVTNLPSLFAALAIVLVVYAAATAPRAKVLGMIFAVASIPLLRNASILTVDLPCAALVAVSVLFLSWRDRPRGPWWLAAAAAAWLAAFLVKETAIWCAAVWLWALVHDLRASGPRAAARTYAPALVIGGALLAGYLALCAHVWGSPFARFTGIQELTHEHAWSFDDRPAGVWLARLTWQPARMFLFMFHATLVPVLAAPFLLRPRSSPWLVATAAFALLYWVGSISLTSYSPLPISPRMALLVLPGVLVVAALASDAALDRLAGSRWRTPIVAVFVLALLVPAGRVMISMAGRPRPETAVFDVLRAEAASGRKLVIVCAEPRCVAIGNFYFRFAVPAHVTLIFAGDFAAAPAPDGATVRAVVNVGRAAAAGRTNPALDRARTIEQLELPALRRQRGVHLYDAGDGKGLWAALNAN